MKKGLKALLAAVLLLGAGFVVYKGFTKETEDGGLPPDIEAITRSAAARFEKNGSPERTVLVESQILALSWTFSSLRLEESDIPVGEWIYRITFDPAPAVKNAGEKVVLTGEESLSINGRLYSTPEEVPFEQVVEVFDGKFEYFSAA